MTTYLVKAKTQLSLASADGRRTQYQAGDMFNVHGMDLRQLLAEGKIEYPCNDIVKKAYDLSQCRITIVGGEVPDGLPVAAQPGNYAFTADRVLFWDARCPVRSVLISTGFDRVAHGWQVAAPLYSYSRLARDIGHADARQLTEEVIHDLRVPVYEYRVLFARRCSDTAHLLETYRHELTQDPEPYLAFMRALYQVKPLMCALPTSWLR